MTLLLSDQRRGTIVAVADFDAERTTQLGHAGDLREPGGIAVTASGAAIVADTGNHRVVGWDVGRATWDVFGSHGADVGQFVRPAAVAIDERDRIMIVDTGNRRVVRMDDLLGAGWTTFGMPGRRQPGEPAIGAFADPRGVAIDTAGRIVIADPGAGRVVRFDDFDGSGWIEIDLPPAPQASRPFGACALSGGRIAITDVWNRRVLVFDESGALVVTIDDSATQPRLPTYLTVDQADLIVADPRVNDVRRFTLAGAGATESGRLRGEDPVLLMSRFDRIGGLGWSSN